MATVLLYFVGCHSQNEDLTKFCVNGTWTDLCATGKYIHFLKVKRNPHRGANLYREICRHFIVSSS